MEKQIQFRFRDSFFNCRFYIDSSASPCYVFVVLEDPELLKLFGGDVTLKTDFEKLLPKQDDYPDLVELRHSLFEVLKTRPEFLLVKEKTKKLQMIK